jgi:bifunctional DNA primase/polymerase-like protein/AAA domain-containing protein/primase-like protein
MTGKTQWRRGRQAIEEAAGGGFAPAPAGETLVELALEYAAFLGWPVFPCKRDKTPYTRHGFKDATTDQEQIRRWWERWPEASIGLPTGLASGVYVVDVDKSHDGTASWQDLESRHGDVLTMVSRTGGGGWHLFFKAPPFELGNTAGRLGPGIDTRGDGGYVVLPPSPHESGTPYEWRQWRAPQHLPGWIVEAARPSRAGEEREEIASIERGARDNTLASAAGALRNIGFDREMIATALEAVNDAHVSPPLPDRDVRRIATSISRYTPGRVLAERNEEADRAGARKWVEYNGLQLAELEDPEVEWVAPRLAARGIVTLLSGEWKTAGKTTLLISAVSAVLHGGKFLGEAVKPGAVLYLYEGPATEFRQNDFAHQLEHENFWLVPQDENAGRTWAETIEYATTRCLEEEASWVIIDTKTAWMSGDGEDENQAGFARSAMNAFADLKLENVAITVAAHPTKVSTSLAKMVAGSGQWAAAAGRQVGLWAHAGVTDTRRELESLGRQGSSNNYPREVIEWDRDQNTYAILGPASALREEQADEERRELRVQQMQALVTAFADDPWGKADAHVVAKEQFGWGQKKTDELLKLALAEGKVDLQVAAHGEHVYMATR